MDICSKDRTNVARNPMLSNSGTRLINMITTPSPQGQWPGINGHEKPPKVEYIIARLEMWP